MQAFTTQHNTTRHDTTQHDTTQHNTTQQQHFFYTQHLQLIITIDRYGPCEITIRARSGDRLANKHKMNSNK